MLYERGNLSQSALQLINQRLPTSIRDCLIPGLLQSGTHTTTSLACAHVGSEFWAAGKTLQVLSSEGYFEREEEEENEEPMEKKGASDKVCWLLWAFLVQVMCPQQGVWPDSLQHMLFEGTLYMCCTCGIGLTETDAHSRG